MYQAVKDALDFMEANATRDSERSTVMSSGPAVAPNGNCRLMGASRCGDMEGFEWGRHGNQEAVGFGGVLMDDKGAWISGVHPWTRRDSSRNGDGLAASSESDQRKSSSSSPS
ncbi:hypothetical protein RHGRI_030631 [Rhododendron griersonianum]|uniref:RNase H type-1 domain-containing protein n=1 Tax=Rhododendron griersonianum TaxID=479676 RepID=A0AAV6I9F5_9ERIC|nr:hypothetical protein RHGRI_030631 [Rhododendron griersonianum]